ncbi:putative cysteine protease family C01A [Phytophthora cinnamomi]|uniref:putative cysteine protease family C01A n=1 Tax=Phytophthora cinnamomi TaxID=4785 RepID=UPI003559E1B0|nr:putative cysteine protease family C01A [Phytophthora cinnamomi]
MAPTWTKWLALAMPAVATQALDPSTFGTLLSCEGTRCLWADRDGAAVSADAMVTQFLQDEGMGAGPSEFRRRMEAHVDYLQQVHQHAAARDWAFSYAMGVNSRHLYHDGDRRLSPSDFVGQEHQAALRQRQRRLAEQRRLVNSTLQLRETLDWCSTDNSHNTSICTDEFELSELAAGSPSAVFDAWIRDVWLAGGDQVHEGAGRGYVGSVRRVPLGVEEEILSAGLPEEPTPDQDDNKIPTICYRVRKPGPFPLESHLAMVRFVDAMDTAGRMPNTLVVWTVKTEMSRVCTWLHCGGLVRLIFRTALKTFLRSLAKSTAKQATNS